MDDKNRETPESEKRLVGLIKAQSKLLQAFIVSTERILNRHEERLDLYREDINPLIVKVEELEANKQDIPSVAQQEMEKIEAAQLAEEKELLASRAHSDILDRIEALEADEFDAPESLDARFKLIEEKMATLEKFIHGRLK